MLVGDGAYQANAFLDEETVRRIAVGDSARCYADGPAGALAGHAWRGNVVVDGRWEAPGTRFVRALAALVWREAGF